MKHLWILVLLAAGCTNYSETRTTELHANEGSTVYLVVEDVAVKTDRTTDQEATSDADAALAQEAATAANAAGSAKLYLDNLKNILDKHKEESNPVTPVIAPVIVKPDPPAKPIVIPTPDPIVEPVTPGEYDNTETQDLKSLEGNDKLFVWHAKTGSFYGGEVMLIWPGCGELIVPDAAVTFFPNGKSQAGWFCGTDFEKGDEEWNNELASSFSPPGCEAKTVTLKYNNQEAE